MLEVNHGVIPGVKKTDWIAGTIPYQIRNPSGNWRSFLVTRERQYFKNFDTMGCVSFATNNTTEIQIKQQTGNEVNFSDRFLAKMSGTTDQGNYVYIVLDTWRNIGCVNEEEWPNPPEPATRQGYYIDIPKFIIDRAPSQSIDKYDLQYEQIIDLSVASIAYHLKHAPLLITMPGHEITGIVLSSSGDVLTCFDHYELNGVDPFIRELKISDVLYIYKAVLTIKGRETMRLVNDNGTTYLVGPKGKIGVADIASENLLKQLDDVQVSSTEGIPNVGTLTHDDAFIIHK